MTLALGTTLAAAAATLSATVTSAWVCHHSRQRTLMQRQALFTGMLASVLLLVTLQHVGLPPEVHDKLGMLSHLALGAVAVTSWHAGLAWAEDLAPVRLPPLTGVWPIAATVTAVAYLFGRWTLGVDAVHSALVCVSLAGSAALVTTLRIRAVARMCPNNMVRHLPWLVSLWVVLGLVSAGMLLSGWALQAAAWVGAALTFPVLGIATQRSARFVLSVEKAGSDSVRALRDALLLLSNDGRVDYANPAAVVLLGSDPQGVHVQAICPEWPVNGQTHVRRVDAQEVAVLVNRSPLRVDGEIVGYAVSITDVTMLQIALDTAREARHRAERAAAARQEFLAVTGHELRTPLTAITGLADLLADSPLDATRRRWAHTIGAGARSLTSQIDNILDYTNLETGALPLETAPLSLTALLEDRLDAARACAAPKGVTYVADLHGLPAMVVGDAHRLGQVVDHLLSNASKYTEAGEVRLAAEYQQGTLRVSVHDTGSGIASNRVPALFQAFERVDASSTRKQSGLGLGLAICAHLVELMEGSIWVERTSSAGTVVSFEIRAAVHHSPAAAIAPPAGPPQCIAQALVVEDNPVNQMVLSAILERMGIKVDVAVNGKEGVDKALAQPYDFIFMDLEMPVMDGWQAMSILRERLPENGPVIVAHSAAGNADIAIRTRAYGAHTFLPKPARPGAIAKLVHSQYSRPANQAAKKPRAETDTGSALPGRPTRAHRPGRDSPPGAR